MIGRIGAIIFRPVDLAVCAVFGHFYSRFSRDCVRCGKRLY